MAKLMLGQEESLGEEMYLHVVTTALSTSWALHFSELQRSIKSIAPEGYLIENASVLAIQMERS